MTGKSAEILNMEAARAKRQDFAANTGFDTAGAYLKGEREALGLSLEDVSKKTHIKTNHLNGIETGDLSLLPARAYVSGFVKTYAEHLGLDASPIVTRFKEDVGLITTVEVEASSFDVSDTVDELEPREMSLWAVIAILGFMFWCGWKIAIPQDATSPADQLEGFPKPSLATVAPAIIDIDQQAIEVLQSDADLLARLVEKVTPIYPRLCEGRAAPNENVEISFNITADGRVAGTRVLSSTNACFERSALNAIKRWRFSPRMVEGVAQPSYDQVYRMGFKKPA